VLLMLYASAVAVMLYIVANRVQEARFEQEFQTTQLLRATDIQSRTERAAERSELETAQREFGELSIFEEVQAAVFVSPENRVLLSSRRDWAGRSLNLVSLGLSEAEQARVDAAMQQARQTGRVVSQFSADRNGLAIVAPAALPLAPGDLRLDRRALILLVYDLRFAKSVNAFRLQQQFAVAMIGVLIAVFGLGVTLHFFVTRRIEHLHGTMARFAAGEPVEKEPRPDARNADEIAHLFRHFTGIAATVNRVNRSLRTISNCNQVLVHATDESSLLNQVCTVIVRDGGYRLAWVALADSTVGGALQPVAYAGPWGRDLSADTLADAVTRAGQAAASLRLESDGRQLGMLNIYSADDGKIEGAELTLLQELADDLAFGLQALRTAASQRQANERYARQEASLTTLMRSYVSAPDDFTKIVREIAEVVARTLDVSQVGVWRHDDRGTSTQCEDLFEWPRMRHSAGEELTEAACPRFFQSIAESDVIAAYDAVADTRTAELRGRYLEPHGISSMMSVAIRSQGSTVGVLSCAHQGPRRRWMPDEQAYALAVANLLSAIIAQVERQRLEQQLRQSQKLEAVGQLAGGVAHDFNNILTVVLGRTEEVADDRRLPPELLEAIAEIAQNAQRATALTRQLLAFSRRQAIQAVDVDINVVVGHLTRMLNRILGEDIVVIFQYSPRPAFVRADPGMIEQVLLNLVVNARDAMPLGGQLVVETSIAVGAARPGRASQPMESWVCLRVTDNGSGIAAEYLPHIFEPFFTTKDVGKGTGLGLATSYGIVQQHGGWIEVDSAVNSGTTFRVFFPHVAAVAVEPQRPAAPPRPPRGDETILVVEDEDGVRGLVLRVLQDLGYRLLQAPTGPRAIEVAREYGATIDMLITDIVMPDGMNGIELAERLRAARPSLKVIFTSGYLADVSRDEIPSRETDAFLAKPFSLSELARLVRHTLDTRAPTADREASL
jgi:signal transduction histidine kinase/ActR/RegA family two-component response regulator